MTRRATSPKTNGSGIRGLFLMERALRISGRLSPSTIAHLKKIDRRYPGRRAILASITHLGRSE